jgi:tetratricopeptide (TPR) repeat protein
MMAGAREGKPDYLDVLVVAAAPVDLRPALNLGVELARLEDMVRRSAIPIRMRRVFPPTYSQLEKELSAPELERKNRELRVLHFLGHGEMDGLWFEREDGSGERIPTNRIVRLLKGSPVKLAFLNACWSATDLVASLCDRLTKEGGIPAAIGHGSPVADASAIAFAREFYRQVVLGKSVGAAKNLAANSLADQGKPGTTEVELKGDGTLLLADGLVEGERAGRVEDGLPLRGSLPGAAFFAGRHDEFTAVAATLGDTEQVAYGLWGIGGIGKTALTLELARRNAWRYPGGIAWVDARDVSPPTAKGMLQLALAELEPASTAPHAGSGLVRLMKEAPVLMVLDNLESLPPDEHQVLSRFLRKVPRNGSRVLLTARSELRDFNDVPGTRSRTLTTGLDAYSGAHHAFHYARLKDVKALRDEYPRMAEGGQVEGKCALVSRRLSGHPRMIELAVGVARHGWEELEKSLNTLSGDLEEQLGRLLETGLKLVTWEGQAMMSFLTFFESGKFMREEMESAAGAGRQIARSGADRELDVEENDDEPNKQTVDQGLEQLERAGLIEFEQDRELYTFHQTLLDHVWRHQNMDPDRILKGLGALLAFHTGYVRDHCGDDIAIDRCAENILSSLEIAWGLREQSSRLDLIICSVVDGLGDHFERRGLWRLGEHWLKRAIALRRSSTLARDLAPLSHELHQLARILRLRGGHAEARKILHESIAVEEELGDRWGRATSLNQLAVIEHDQGNPAAARRLLHESIAVEEELGDGYGRAASLHQLAIIERDQGNPAEAIRLLRESIFASDQLGDRWGRPTSLHQLAIIEHDQGNPTDARRLLRESIVLEEELGDRHGRATSLHQLAIIEHDQGNPTEARRLLRESIVVKEELGDRHGRATSLHQLAIIEHAQGNLAEARSLLHESIAVKEELGDRLGRAASLHVLAMIERAQGNPAEARRLLHESIAVMDELGDRRGRAVSISQLATIEHDQGNPAEARRLLHESIAVMDELGDRRARASCLYLLAMIEYAQGHLAEARSLLLESVAVKEEVGDSHGRAAVLHLLAIIEHAEGNSAEARRLVCKSITLLEELGDRRGRAAALHQMAMIEHAVGTLAEVRGLLEDAIEISKEVGDLEGIATSLAMLAQLNALERRFDEAVDQGRDAVRLLEGIGSFKAFKARRNLRWMEARQSLEDLAHPDLVGALRDMPPEEALSSIEPVLAQARADGQAKMEVMLLAVRALKHWQTGNIEACDQVLEEAGRALECVKGEERPQLEAWLAQQKEQRERAGQGLAEALRLYNEGSNKAQNGDNAGALKSFEELADLCWGAGDDHWAAVSLLCVGHALLALGRASEARAKLAEGLDLATKLGDEELLEEFRTVAAMAAEGAPA